MSDEAPAAPENNPPPPTPAPGEPPPAARIVVTGVRSETEVQLQSELDAERARHAKTADEKKQREVRVAELEDEMHRLKQSTQAPPAKKQSFGWFEEE
jgi:hypothetical protein